MAGYVPWYGKKAERLARREEELAEVLRTKGDGAKVLEAAEAVRAAQVRALRSKRAQLLPSEKSAAAFERIDREIDFWMGVAVEQIIDGYRSGKLRVHRSAATRRSGK